MASWDLLAMLCNWGREMGGQQHSLYTVQPRKILPSGYWNKEQNKVGTLKIEISSRKFVPVWGWVARKEKNINGGLMFVIGVAL